MKQFKEWAKNIIIYFVLALVVAMGGKQLGIISQNPVLLAGALTIGLCVYQLIVLLRKRT